MMRGKDWAIDIWVLSLMVAIAIANFTLFGLIHDPGWKDAADYSGYAKNLLLGNGYSLDGTNFNVYREPGVSFYLIPFYITLGIETPVALFAASFAQALLLGVLGFIFYLILKRYSHAWVAIALGAIVAAQPILGDHTHAVGAEAIFTTMLGVIFILCVRIMSAPESTRWYWYALLGFACGVETLIRTQFVLFLPFIVTCCILYFLYARKLPQHAIRNAIIAMVVFAAIPLSFATYIYAHTGVFAITQGRQEEMLYYRARRAQLSYRDITQYLHDWLLRSVSGGYNSQLLTDNEFKKLGYEYGLIATTSEAVARIRAENIQTILSRPGHYLFGNVVEMIKLAYIEHDYSDTLNRYFRPVQYACIYSFFLFGLYQLVRIKASWDIKSPAILSLVFLAYNYLSLSFVSVVPRFNSPYLPFYIFIGFLGVVALLRQSTAAKGTSTAAWSKKVIFGCIGIYAIALLISYAVVLFTTSAFVQTDCSVPHAPSAACPAGPLESQDY